MPQQVTYAPTSAPGMYLEYCTEDGRPVPYMGQYVYRADSSYVYEPYLDSRAVYPVNAVSYPHAYDNPSSSSSSTNPRTPSRLFGHRRTPSNVSNASSTNTSSSNINPSFRLEDEEVVVVAPQYATPSRSRHYPDATEYVPGGYYLRQNSAPPLDTDPMRPGTLQLRSGVRKFSYAPASKPPSGWGSGAGTPTNPTPPDSLTSEDSSYVSTKDGTFSRVR